MSFGSIKSSRSDLDPIFNKHVNTADATSVVMDIQKKRFKLRKSKIKDIARGLAEVAFSMGETNDVEDFAEQMAQDIFEGIKKAEKRRKERNS
ncbi:MAG: hypothetical protein EXS67_04855 [Candidatus Margulisbacteria bacterium]|nr:hypothetical protein [Candidatus Margulisiibacteriota bacterium]